MNKHIMTVIVAVSLILFGAVLSLTALSAMDYNFELLNTVNLDSRTVEVTDEFDSLDISTAEGDVTLLPSTDGHAHVTFRDSKKITHTVAVKDGTLTVTRIDSRKWYEHIGIYWGTMDITVYLPEAQYDSVRLKSVSGNVVVKDEFEFTELNALSTSGDVTLFDITADSAGVKTVSGDIVLKNVSVAGDATVKSTSGDVEFERLSAATLDIKTVSGDIDGSVTEPMLYTADTVSGDVKLPPSFRDGGSCTLKTTSGDIEITEK